SAVFGTVRLPERSPTAGFPLLSEPVPGAAAEATPSDACPGVAAEEACELTPAVVFFFLVGLEDGAGCSAVTCSTTTGGRSTSEPERLCAAASPAGRQTIIAADVAAYANFRMS